jgi:hypothetical protein
MARVRGIKQPHPLGSVASRAGYSRTTANLSQLTAASGATSSHGGVKISSLPAAGAANDVDQLEVNQAGTTRRITLDQVSALVTAALPSLGTIDVGAAIGGSDAEDFIAPLNALMAAPENDGCTFLFRRNRAWISPTRPPELTGSFHCILPQHCVLEWEPGAVWDLTGWANQPAEANASVLGRDCTWGTDVPVLTVPLAAGTRTVTVAATAAMALQRGQRLLLAATAGFTDLAVGAFTLQDGMTALSAYAEDVFVAEWTATTITFVDPVKFTYVDAANAVLRAVVGESRISLINPCATGPGRTATFDSQDDFLAVTGGRNLVVEGGQLDNFGSRTLRLHSIRGGHVRDLSGIGPVDPGTAGTGSSLIVPMGTMADFVIDNCVSHGYSQAFMESGSGPPGIIDGMTYRDCVSYAPTQGGFTTHNLAQNSTWVNCRVIDSGRYGFDLRCRNSRLINCAVDRSAFQAIILRAAIRGTVIDGFVARSCVGGLVLEPVTTLASWDYVPDNLAILNSRFEDVRSPYVGIDLSFLPPPTTLGTVTLANNHVSMTTSVHAIVLTNRWQRPKVINTVVSGSGTGRSVFITENAGMGDGSESPVIRGLMQAASYALPSTSPFTGLTTQEDITIDGLTSSGPIRITNVAASPYALKNVQAGQVFNNTGAAAKAVINLPAASETLNGKPFTFYVTDGDGIDIVAAGDGDDKIRIGSGTESAVNGRITSTTVGSWCRVWTVTSTSWVAEVDAAANWTVT